MSADVTIQNGRHDSWCSCQSWMGLVEILDTSLISKCRNLKISLFFGYIIIFCYCFIISPFFKDGPPRISYLVIIQLVNDFVQNVQCLKHVSK